MNDWCERGDSNPHGFTRQILSLVRLPIPPLSHFVFSYLHFAPCDAVDEFCRCFQHVDRSFQPRRSGMHVPL